ncbi:hypothetical protein BJ944DRAFT_263677 [Cunninghamella echinulata]|nr:hypothetical protein BJ944DRAFT_263677 [Cunninghamella echinulata]
MGNNKRKRSYSKSQQEKQRKKELEEEEEMKKLFIFGYEAQLFKNTTQTNKASLIPWQNGILLDRYDIRHLIEDEKVKYYLEKRIENNYKEDKQLDNDEEGEEENIELNKERYQDLDPDEDLLFEMTELERIEYLEEKYHKDKEGNCIPFNYDEQQPNIVLSEKQLQLLQKYNIQMTNSNDFKIPTIPSNDGDDDDIHNNKKDHEKKYINENEQPQQQEDDRLLIKEIDKIAQLISSQSNPKLYEIRYQVQNHHLTFLNQHNDFHPFYQHVLNYYINLKKKEKFEKENKKISSLVDYASSSDDDEA